MADELSIVLHSLAEYFNYFAVVLILLCSVMMTIFIIRAFFDRHGEHLRLYRGGPGHGTSSLAFHRPMTEFCNPFFLQLAASKGASFEEGFYLDLSCLEPSDVLVFWGAPINPLHAALLQTGITFMNNLSSGILLREDSLVTDKHRLESAGKHTLRLPVPPEFKPEQLGAPPRQRYPCVVIMTAAGGLRPGDELNQVVALVTVIHIKDEHCRMDTHIMAQYAKLSGTAVYNLQPLFFATEFDHETNTTAPPQSSQPCDVQDIGKQQHSNSLPSQGAQASADSSGGEGDHWHQNRRDKIHKSVGSQLHHRRVHAEDQSLKTNEDESKSDSRQKNDMPVKENREGRRGKCDSKPEISMDKEKDSEESWEGQTYIESKADSASNDEPGERVVESCGVSAGSDLESAMLPSAFAAEAANAEGSMADLNLSNPLISQMSNNLPDCIVCQNQQLTCVLLPCRHACVCRSCFQQLDRCPMCRSHIESFFTLTESDDDDDGKDERGEERPMHWWERWERLNERLNRFFGFD